MGDLALLVDIPAAGVNNVWVGGMVSLGNLPQNVWNAQPVPGTECSIIGKRCPYGDPLIDFLCTSEGLWVRRQFMPAEGGAPGMEGAFEQPEAESCPRDSIQDCSPRHCIGGLCDDDRACCFDKPCSNIPAVDCLAGRCQLVRGCNDELLCTPPRILHRVGRSAISVLRFSGARG